MNTSKFLPQYPNRILKCALAVGLANLFGDYYLAPSFNTASSFGFTVSVLYTWIVLFIAFLLSTTYYFLRAKTAAVDVLWMIGAPWASVVLIQTVLNSGLIRSGAIHTPGLSLQEFEPQMFIILLAFSIASVSAGAFLARIIR